jgi:solute carrier family 6 (neurotransmitter transporter), invertebrate
VCFNILITAIATIFYLMQFENPTTPIPSQYIYPELSTLSVIYDRALTERDHTLARLIPGLSFAMIALSSLISLVVCIYTATRMMRRHPNYTVCLVGLVLAISGLLCPDFIVARLMDSRVVGSLIVCALIFDVIGTIWIYGSKNIYTDLEFSIGRPIFKVWLLLWTLAPIVLATILVWWLVSYTGADLLGEWLPRWLPVVVSLVLIFVMACVEVGKQVDYNLCSMITGAAKPSKDWGPCKF